MEIEKNEMELLGRLYFDIDTCDKERIVLLGGHFPLIYTQEGAIEALNHWGEFSPYTLELACKVGEQAKRKGKKVRFVIFVDDHTYESTNSLSNSQVSLRRNKLYKLRSGPNAELPELYRRIMSQYGFSEKDILVHNHGKKGRMDCLYFSEKVLRASKKAIDNPCAREYIEFLENGRYFDKTNSYIIAFIPQRCKGNICDIALNQKIQGLSGSHIFLESMAQFATREQLYSSGRGVLYKKD